MCSHKTLAHSNSGFIILCNDCGHFQVAFGTSAFKLDVDNYAVFCLQIETLFEVHDSKGFKQQKNIHIDINSSNSMLVLSHIELNKLNDLVNQANFTLEMNIMLECNKITN